MTICKYNYLNTHCFRRPKFDTPRRSDLDRVCHLLNRHPEGQQFLQAQYVIS
jgi:hypothetical protein